MVLVSNQYVVQLEVIVDKTCFVDLLKNFNELDTNLADRLETERLFSGIKVVLKSKTQLFHYNKRVDLIFNFLVHKFCRILVSNFLKFYDEFTSANELWKV